MVAICDANVVIEYRRSGLPNAPIHMKQETTSVREIHRPFYKIEIKMDLPATPPTADICWLSTE